METTTSEGQMRPAVPIAYSVLSLPSKAEMRKYGFDPDHVDYNGGLAAHPLAKWKSERLPPNCTYKDAMTKVENANAPSWGPLKIRLQFSDGHYEQFERSDLSMRDSLKSTTTYNPNDVFTAATKTLTTTRRAQQTPRLKPLVDDRGHHLSSKPIPRTFAPEVLYKDCPPPVPSQAGYDFTPMSSIGFQMKPADPWVGMRDVRSALEHKSCDFRSRAYLRAEGDGCTHASRHCHCNEVFQVGDCTVDYAAQAETINHRNKLTKKEYSALGTLKMNSAIVGTRNAQQPRFACSSMAATAAGSKSRTPPAALEAEQLQ